MRLNFSNCVVYIVNNEVWRLFEGHSRVIDDVRKGEYLLFVLKSLCISEINMKQIRYSILSYMTSKYGQFFQCTSPRCQPNFFSPLRGEFSSCPSTESCVHETQVGYNLQLFKKCSAVSDEQVKELMARNSLLTLTNWKRKSKRKAYKFKKVMWFVISN